MPHSNATRDLHYDTNINVDKNVCKEKPGNEQDKATLWTKAITPIVVSDKPRTLQERNIVLLRDTPPTVEADLILSTFTFSLPKTDSNDGEEGNDGPQAIEPISAKADNNDTWYINFHTESDAINALNYIRTSPGKTIDGRSIRACLKRTARGAAGPNAAPIPMQASGNVSGEVHNSMTNRVPDDSNVDAFEAVGKIEANMTHSHLHYQFPRSDATGVIQYNIPFATAAGQSSVAIYDSHGAENADEIAPVPEAMPTRIVSPPVEGDSSPSTNIVSSNKFDPAGPTSVIPAAEKGSSSTNLNAYRQQHRYQRKNKSVEESLPAPKCDSITDVTKQYRLSKENGRYEWVARDTDKYATTRPTKTTSVDSSINTKNNIHHHKNNYQYQGGNNYKKNKFQKQNIKHQSSSTAEQKTSFHSKESHQITGGVGYRNNYNKKHPRINKNSKHHSYNKSSQTKNADSSSKDNSKIREEFSWNDTTFPELHTSKQSNLTITPTKCVWTCNTNSIRGFAKKDKQAELTSECDPKQAEASQKVFTPCISKEEDVGAIAVLSGYAVALFKSSQSPTCKSSVRSTTETVSSTPPPSSTSSLTTEVEEDGFNNVITPEERSGVKTHICMMSSSKQFVLSATIPPRTVTTATQY